MRLIHTADWHLGKHIEGHSRLEEQELFLEDFVNIVKERDADVVLIAGDIYDSSNPPSMMITFLERCRQLWSVLY